MPQVVKRIAKTATKSPLDDTCEDCGSTFKKGEPVLKCSEGEYEYYVHEVCPGEIR